MRYQGPANYCSMKKKRMKYRKAAWLETVQCGPQLLFCRKVYFIGMHGRATIIDIAKTWFVVGEHN